MRETMPRPILLALTLMLVIGAVVFLELRLDAPGAADARANANKQPEEAVRIDEQARGTTNDLGEEINKTTTSPSGDTERSEPAKRNVNQEQKPTVSGAERIAIKEKRYSRAREITGSTGLINTDGVSIRSAAGEKVVLVEFWTYS